MKFCFVLLLAIVSSGCSLLPSSSEENQNQLSAVQHWQVQGKLSVRQGNDNITGYMTWEQQADAFDLFLTGPLGQGSSRISGNAEQARLVTPELDDALTAATPEQLLLEHMGWSIPVQGIRYWIKGQPAPVESDRNHTSGENSSNPAAAEYDDYGLLSRLQQDGWTIRFKRYQQYQGVWLPGLVRLSGYDYNLTLAINNWTLYD